MRFSIMACALVLSVGAHASELSSSIGNEYFGVHYSHDLNQLKLSADLVHNFDHEDTIANIGLGKNIALGSNTLTVGAKVNFLDFRYQETEYAMSFGGDLAIPLTSQFALYGSAYWAPEFAASGNLTSYVDAAAGVRFNISKPLSIDLGYRYSQAEFDSHYTRTVADGLYAAVGFNF
ncbi:YfaZ family protein [Deefgea tanakiae]|uniref:YfaZ family protein n=1 Tax=Deefgea tanakiae TaxID=2865840 RepID=A0ABX8Z8A4_9NEIS|nr:YfaZ family outer membrane protein [Deefgea tanakiae]QZA77318.1 YfaZ family protein [Deefgea tanakiae]